MPLRDIVRQFAPENWGWFEFTCGHCGRPASCATVTVVVSETLADESRSEHQTVVVCAHCRGATVLVGEDPRSPEGAFPSRAAGRDIDGLPKDVRTAWDEARAALSAGAPTAAEHMCRKILLHVAVEKGADRKSNFFESVEFLFKNGHLPTQMRPWVDRIRLNGNEAAHELEAPDEARAEATLAFTEELLHLVFEMDHAMNRFPPKK